MNQTTMDQINELLKSTKLAIATAQNLVESIDNLMRIEEVKGLHESTN